MGKLRPTKGEGFAWGLYVVWISLGELWVQWSAAWEHYVTVCVSASLLWSGHQTPLSLSLASRCEMWHPAPWSPLVAYAARSLVWGSWRDVHLYSACVSQSRWTALAVPGIIFQSFQPVRRLFFGQPPFQGQMAGGSGAQPTPIEGR